MRKLTSRSSLVSLKRESKRWLTAIRAGDPEAIDRFRLALASHPQSAPHTLRDVQHALAREHGFDGWIALTRALEDLREKSELPVTPDVALQELLRAALRGDAQRVDALLDAYPDIVNERALLEGHDGRRTALHHGVAHEAVVRTLLDRGADPNIRDDGDDAMPLHFAAERGDLAVVRLLIEHGADPDGVGTHHDLPVLGWATCFEYAYHQPVADYLLAHGARHTIHTAVAMGNVEAIRRIGTSSQHELDRAMDATNRQRRPLHLAIIKRRLQSLVTLLELGADVEAEDAAGLTPLDEAALSGQHEMAPLLLEHGARLRLPAAVALDRHEDVEMLLQGQPDSLRPGGRWARLIIRASEKGSAKVVEALIRGGASVHVRDDHRTATDNTHGYTALHAAASVGSVETVKVLLDHGANPADREDKYWGTPASWAEHAGRTEARDLILNGPIDIFDAIQFRPDRIPEILSRDPDALERPFGEYVTGDAASKPWLDPRWTPVAFAIARERHDVARDLERAARVARPDASPELQLADFLRMSVPDWRQSGSEREYRRLDAARLLERHPELATANIFAAVVCGELETVHSLLERRPGMATEIGGPRSWPPLLYLCAGRLPTPKAAEQSDAIARLLLDYGADPNVFYLGGNADIHYTALTCVLGRGEELAPMHARARELTRLLLERGADPHDNQVLYNVFANNTSRSLLGEDIVWLLELMYEHSVRRGHKASWDDPEWPMFDMRGAPSLGHDARRHPGAHFMLSAAIDRNLLALAQWMLEHGAGPNTSPGALWQQFPKRSLYEEATVRGHREMAQLLVQYGALPTVSPLDDRQRFAVACLGLDRAAATQYVEQHPEALSETHALFEAVRRDRADVVEMLLDLGVSPNVEDSQARTRALHIAAAGSERSAELLIARGADVDARDAMHDSPPLGWAAWMGQQRMIELYGRYSRDVWYLTYTGRVERLRQLLAEQPELARTTGSTGHTPLLWLPGEERVALEIVRLFVTLGADRSARNDAGLTAADIARRRGMLEVADMLAAK